MGFATLLMLSASGCSIKDDLFGENEINQGKEKVNEYSLQSVLVGGQEVTTAIENTSDFRLFSSSVQYGGNNALPDIRIEFSGNPDNKDVPNSLKMELIDLSNATRLSLNLSDIKTLTNNLTIEDSSYLRIIYDTYYGLSWPLYLFDDQTGDDIKEKQLVYSDGAAIVIKMENLIPYIKKLSIEKKLENLTNIGHTLQGLITVNDSMPLGSTYLLELSTDGNITIDNKTNSRVDMCFYIAEDENRKPNNSEIACLYEKYLFSQFTDPAFTLNTFTVNNQTLLPSPENLAQAISIETSTPSKLELELLVNNSNEFFNYAFKISLIDTVSKNTMTFNLNSLFLLNGIIDLVPQAPTSISYFNSSDSSGASSNVANDSLSTLSVQLQNNNQGVITVGNNKISINLTQALSDIGTEALRIKESLGANDSAVNILPKVPKNVTANNPYIVLIEPFTNSRITVNSVAESFIARCIAFTDVNSSDNAANLVCKDLQ